MYIPRILKNLAKHPGTWTFLALLSVGIAIAVPPAAPALAIAAAVFTAGAVPTSFHFFGTNRFTWGKDDDLPKRNKFSWRGDSFFENHPIQLAIGIIAFGLFVTALVLTIGFFTGGAGFVFMAPVFAAIAAPFATAAASAGIQLAVSALAAVVLVFASINIPNTLKRFSAWLDGFIYDGAAARTNGGKTALPQVRNKRTNQLQEIALEDDWEEDRYRLADAMVKGEDGKFSLVNYLSLFADGVKATITNNANNKGYCTSPDSELLYPPKEEEKVHQL